MEKIQSLNNFQSKLKYLIVVKCNIGDEVFLEDYQEDGIIKSIKIDKFNKISYEVIFKYKGTDKSIFVEQEEFEDEDEDEEHYNPYEEKEKNRKGFFIIGLN